MTDKQLSQIDLTDIQRFRNGGIGESRQRQVLLNVLDRPGHQWVLNILPGCDFVQQLIKCAEKLKLALSVFQCFKAVQAGLGIAQRNHQDLIVGKAFTPKIHQGKDAVLIAEKGIVTALGQDHRHLLVRNILFFTHCVCDLSVDTQRKTEGGPVRHLKFTTLFRVDDLGRFHFSYYDVF